jgi:predicted metal-dependent peptidase
MPELNGLVAHEVVHVVLMHPWKIGEAIKRYHITIDEAQICADYVVNAILIDAKVTLPKGALYDPKYKGKSFEQVILIRLEEQKQPEQDKGDDEGDDKSDDEGDTASVNIGNCGECRQATTEDGQPLTDSQKRQAMQEWAINIIQAAEQAQTMGHALGEGITMLVDGLTNPRLDWRIYLSEFMGQSAKSDYRWNPPNRLYTQQGIYMPTLSAEGIKVVIVRDTSGSMLGLLNASTSEITGILESTQQVEATVIDADDQIQQVTEYTTQDLPFCEPCKGGYGTDFRPAFQYVEDNDIRPDCLVYLTDLYGTFPEFPPEYPVLWVDVTNGDVIPPWGEVVRVPVED